MGNNTPSALGAVIENDKKNNHAEYETAPTLKYTMPMIDNISGNTVNNSVGKPYCAFNFLRKHDYDTGRFMMELENLQLRKGNTTVNPPISAEDLYDSITYILNNKDILNEIMEYHSSGNANISSENESNVIWITTMGKIEAPDSTDIIIKCKNKTEHRMLLEHNRLIKNYLLEDTNRIQLLLNLRYFFPNSKNKPIFDYDTTLMYEYTCVKYDTTDFEGYRDDTHLPEIEYSKYWNSMITELQQINSYFDDLGLLEKIVYKKYRKIVKALNMMSIGNIA